MIFRVSIRETFIHVQYYGHGSGTRHDYKILNDGRLWELPTNCVDYNHPFARIRQMFYRNYSQD